MLMGNENALVIISSVAFKNFVALSMSKFVLVLSFDYLE